MTPTPGSVSGRRIDRVGDPLEGLVNLFDLSLVLAVGLLLAALSSTGLVGIVSGGGSSGAPINGQPQGQSGQGQGQEVGKVYRLQNGSYVFAPTGGAKTSGATGATSVVPTPSTGVSPGTGSSPSTGSFGSTAGGTQP